MNNETNFQSNLKYIRDAYGLTQNEMSKKLDVSLKSYQSYEEGRSEPNSAMIIKFCCTLNLTFEILFKSLLSLSFTHVDVLRKSVKKSNTTIISNNTP